MLSNEGRTPTKMRGEFPAGLTFAPTDFDYVDNVTGKLDDKPFELIHGYDSVGPARVSIKLGKHRDAVVDLHVTPAGQAKVISAISYKGKKPTNLPPAKIKGILRKVSEHLGNTTQELEDKLERNTAAHGTLTQILSGLEPRPKPGARRKL